MLLALRRRAGCVGDADIVRRAMEYRAGSRLPFLCRSVSVRAPRPVISLCRGSRPPARQGDYLGGAVRGKRTDRTSAAGPRRTLAPVVSAPDRACRSGLDDPRELAEQVHRALSRRTVSGQMGSRNPFSWQISRRATPPSFSTMAASGCLPQRAMAPAPGRTRCRFSLRTISWARGLLIRAIRSLSIRRRRGRRGRWWCATASCGVRCRTARAVTAPASGWRKSPGWTRTDLSKRFTQCCDPIQLGRAGVCTRSTGLEGWNASMALRIRREVDWRPGGCNPGAAAANFRRS